MKLELSFGSFKDLKEQLQIMIDELSGTESNQLDLDLIYDGNVTITPVTYEVSEPVVEAPKKRTRRTKEQIEAEKNQPVVAPAVLKVPDVEQPVLPEVVEAPIVAVEPVVETPKNFYSLSEFSVNFAIVLNTLLNDGSLTIGDLENTCKYYDVKNIYLISKDIAMMEHYYNDLVARQVITKKGDY